MGFLDPWVRLKPGTMCLGRVRAGVARAGDGGSLASSQGTEWRAGVLVGLPSGLASCACGSGAAAGVSTDGARGQRRVRSAWRFWAVCRLRAPIAAAIRDQVAPPSRAASMRASSLRSSSAAMRRTAAQYDRPLPPWSRFAVAARNQRTIDVYSAHVLPSTTVAVAPTGGGPSSATVEMTGSPAFHVTASAVCRRSGKPRPPGQLASKRGPRSAAGAAARLTGICAASATQGEV